MLPHSVFPSFRAAAVQACPVFLGAEKTAAKAAALIAVAAGNGARRVFFPQLFVPGCSYWNRITEPVTGQRVVRQAGAHPVLC